MLLLISLLKALLFIFLFGKVGIQGIFTFYLAGFHQMAELVSLLLALHDPRSCGFNRLFPSRHENMQDDKAVNCVLSSDCFFFVQDLIVS